MTFPTALAAKLSGATLHQVTYWRSEGLLVPELEHVAVPFLYSFRDLITLRTFAWLRSDHSLQQIRTSLRTANLLEVVNHPSEFTFVKLGSSVGLEQPRFTVDVAKHPGQQLLGTMSDVLDAFVTRQGRPVRALASPHESIEVDIDRLGGWPTIEGTRVPYDAVVRLLSDGSIQPEQIQQYLPTVSTAAARDALDFSREVDGLSAAAA